MKIQTACFTGHRNMKNDILTTLYKNLNLVIESLVNKNVQNFLNGGARGFDLFAASCVIKLRDLNPMIKLHLVLPCVEQTKGWNNNDVIKYNYVLENADSIKYLSKQYYDRCMLDRNDFMINNSQYCIAFLNSTYGGTAYTVNQARSKGLTVYNLCDIDM